MYLLGIDGIAPTRNPGVDNARFAQTAESAANANEILDQPANTGNGRQTKTSVNPRILSWENDVDLCGARTKGLSHSVFAHINYNWDLCSCWDPYLGVGFKAEFAPNGSSKSHSSTNCCTTGCQQCALSQWGVWIKGGASFN